MMRVAGAFLSLSFPKYLPPLKIIYFIFYPHNKLILFKYMERSLFVILKYTDTHTHIIRVSMRACSGEVVAYMMIINIIVLNLPPIYTHTYRGFIM